MLDPARSVARTSRRLRPPALVGAALVLAAVLGAQPLGTAFTYQGRLGDSMGPANGSFDFDFRLFDAEMDGNPVGTVVALSPVLVSGGLFTVSLDFGAGAFDGLRRWLEIRVRPTGGGSYAVLSPRQEITSAPNALWSSKAGDAQTLGGVSSSGFMLAGAVVTIGQGGTGASDAVAARANLEAAKSGTNADITALSGLTTPLSIAQGGTGGAMPSGALMALDAQARVTGSCSSGQYVRSVNADGTVVCGTDADTNSGGTVTSVATGAGLSGGPIATAGTLAIATGGVTSGMIATGAVGAAQIDSSQVQARVSGTCPVGQHLRAVNANGSVQCDTSHLAPAILTSVFSSQAHVSIAVGPDGLPVISGQDSFSDPRLMVVKCGNVTCSSFSFGTPPSVGRDSGLYTSIAIAQDGLPVVSYHNQELGRLEVVKCSNVTCQSDFPRVVDDPAASMVGLYTSIAIGQDGSPVISYYDQTAGALKVAKCTDSSCNGTVTITTVDDADAVGRSTSIAIGTDGFPVISYQDFTGKAVKVAKCGNAACTAGNTTRVVDTNPPFNVGTYTSIAIDQDGLPVIGYSYSNATSYQLRTARCTNVACTATFTPFTIATGPNNSVSMAIGQTGYPVLSYVSGGALKVAKCLSPGCGSSTRTEVDASPTCAAFYTSIAIGQDGFPVVSYTCDGVLKVAKCNTASCGPY